MPDCDCSTMDFKFESGNITFELAENVSNGWKVVPKQTPIVSFKYLCLFTFMVHVGHTSSKLLVNAN